MGGAVRDDLLAAKMRNEALRRELRDAKDKLEAAERLLAEEQRRSEEASASLERERAEPPPVDDGPHEPPPQSEASKAIVRALAQRSAGMERAERPASTDGHPSMHPFLVGVVIGIFAVGGILFLALSSALSSAG